MPIRVVATNSEPPNITVQPQTQTVSTGASVAFHVTATGGPFTYQWKLNGTNIGGANGDSYTIAAAATSDVGDYTVVVSNSVGYVEADAARLALLDLKMLAALYLTGPIGSEYRIEYRPVLEPTNWMTLTNITLPTQPYIYVDYDSAAEPQRFYRAVPLP